MQIPHKSKVILKIFSSKQVAAAKAAAAPPAPPDGIDWSHGVVTPGGGVAATIGALRKTRGKNKNPTKEQVAIRIDPEVLAAFRADGPGWQTRMNTALKEWLGEHRRAPVAAARRKQVAKAAGLKR